MSELAKKEDDKKVVDIEELARSISDYALSSSLTTMRYRKSITDINKDRVLYDEYVSGKSRIHELQISDNFLHNAYIEKVRFTNDSLADKLLVLNKKAIKNEIKKLKKGYRLTKEDNVPFIRELLTNSKELDEALFDIINEQDAIPNTIEAVKEYINNRNQFIFYELISLDGTHIRTYIEVAGIKYCVDSNVI